MKRTFFIEQSMNSTSFLELIKNGDVASLEVAISKWPELINQPDPRGFPPLVMATYTNNVEMTKLLIQHGARIDAKDAAGNTALMGVSFKGFYEMAKSLIHNGADVNAKNHRGDTPLSFAITYDQYDIAKMLIHAGADKGVVDANGNSLLMIAESKKNREMIELLTSN